MNSRELQARGRYVHLPTASRRSDARMHTLRLRQTHAYIYTRTNTHAEKHTLWQIHTEGDRAQWRNQYKLGIKYSWGNCQGLLHTQYCFACIIFEQQRALPCAASRKMDEDAEHGTNSASRTHAVYVHVHVCICVCVWVSVCLYEWGWE